MAATLPKSVRYHALDIWRGIVCLVVVIEHAGVALWSVRPAEVAGGLNRLGHAIVTSLSLNVGAPLFFVISGYCIAASLDSTRRKGIRPSIFLARRLWRIFPPYWASMAIIAVIVLLLNAAGLRRWHQTDIGLELYDPQSFSLSQWIGNLTLTETWRPRVSPESPIRFLNRVAWALCYQEQFYLLCFLSLVCLPKRLYGALGCVTLLIVAFRMEIADLKAERYIMGFLPYLWHEFAVGLFLYWRINVAESSWSKRAIELSFVGLFCFGLNEGLVTTQAAALFGLVLLGFHRWDAFVAGIKQFDPLRALGKRSYSVYLIHLPICTVGNAALAEAGLNSFWQRTLVMIPAVTIGSVAAGWLFYAAIDRHFGNFPIVGRFARLVKPPQPGVAIPHAQV